MATKTLERPWGHLEPVTFGTALKKRVKKAHIGGMPGIERPVVELFGPHLGRRSTLNELYSLENAPSDPEDANSARAWVVLALVGEDPGVWGVPDSVLPAVWGSPVELRERLRAEGEALTSKYAALYVAA